MRGAESRRHMRKQDHEQNSNAISMPFSPPRHSRSAMNQVAMTREAEDRREKQKAPPAQPRAPIRSCEIEPWINRSRQQTRMSAY